MEKMRHFLGSRSALGMMPPSSGAESGSVFHINNCSEDGLGQEMRDCYQGIEEFRSAMKNLDGAGTHLTESLAHVLRGTNYQRVGEQLSGGFREVYGSQGSLRFLEQLKEMEGVLLGAQVPREGGQEDLRMTYAQTSCHVLLLFAKLQKQYFHMCHQKMADLIHHLLAAKDPDRSSEITKFILKLGLAEELSPDKAIASLPSTPWGSPKLRGKVSHGSPKSQRGFKLFHLFERKPSPEEGRSAFYVSMPEGDRTSREPTPELLVELQGSQPVTAGSLGSLAPNPEGSLLGSVPLVTRTDEMNNECAPDFTPEDSANALASEEDLDSVISLLSGVNCRSPALPPTPNSMLSIPEDPLRDTSPSTPNSMHSGPELHHLHSPMQLTVPNMYRMRSPVSDSHVDELQIPRLQAQVHRRSEGCLDLSGMGRNTWPHPHHQHHQHHRASLPAVQLHPSYHQAYDPAMADPLGLPGRYLSQDFTVPSRPPPGYLGSSSSGGGSGSGNGSMCGSGLTPGLQWSSYGGGGGGVGVGMEMRNSGTWPLYQPVNMPMGDSLNSSWSGAQDGSDGSDDSSNGDHFFAVGKDLVSAMDSRHESSDDEGDGGRNKIQKDFFDYDRQIGCTNTWPMMQHLPTSGIHFPPAGDYNDLLDPPPPTPHRPLQMQWSDPLATRSNVWSAANTGGVTGHKSSQGIPPPNNTFQSMHGFGRLN